MIKNKVKRNNTYKIEKKFNKGAEIIYITRSNSEIEKIDENLINCVLFERDKDTEIYIRHPFLSEKITVTYINNNEYFDYGIDLWNFADSSTGQFTVTLFEKQGKIITYSGQDGYLFHKLNGCKRVRLKIPSGQGYDLCEGCNPKNHSEPSALRRAKKYKKYKSLQGSNAYLYGHWWSCIDCSNALEKAGVKTLYISKVWTRKFLGI